MYLLYFKSENLFQQYKEPKCNQYCTPLTEPQVSFVIKCSYSNEYKLHISNACEL